MLCRIVEEQLMKMRMQNFRSLPLWVLIVLCLIAVTRCQLRPDGENVKKKYEAYYVTQATSTRVTRHRSTCRRTCSSYTLWWCSGYKDVCTNVYYQVWVTVYKRVRKTRPVYICKVGWKPKGSECTTPICTGGCQNGGACISPQTCHCGTGWTGSRCASDIDECKTIQNKCEYKPGCRNTPGDYTCSCSSGFFLNGDQRSCSDIDECSTGQYSCRPNTTCLNIPGNYSCPCIAGFMVNPPGNLCEDIDECSPSSGIVHGCQMKCNNLPGNYSCSCDQGFNLTSNGRDCSDHDECKGNRHGCEQQCLNLPGGYTCTCSVGYRLNAKDLKTCDDINECSENISGCAQNCKNTFGGFKCSCNHGYLLRKDLKSCIDVDECSKPVDYCHQVCLNTPGSYRCSCRHGFHLHLDGKSCIGRPCFPIYKPIKGMKNCTGYRTEDVCNFQCLPGYDLSGSPARSCGPNKQWTGNNTECQIIHCANPSEPGNGFVYSPCATHYGSRCSFGCNNGHFTDSGYLSCDADGLWKPSNASCKEIELCQPNPCLHNGTCSVVNEDKYTCECTHTGYRGTKCEIGFFKISDYPKITQNVLSPPIAIVSSPPTEYVILHLMSPDLIFSSPRLVFNPNTPLNQSIRVTAREEGYYLIKYSLIGPNAREFKVPEEDIIFVNTPNNATQDSSIEKSALDFPYGCYKKHFGTCPGLNASIILSSTSPFVSFGPLSTTLGVVAIEVGNFMKLPLSLLGVNLPDSSANSLVDSCKDNGDVTYTVESIVKSRALAKSFINTATENLPTWINVTLGEGNLGTNIYSTELRTRFLNGLELREAGVGTGLPVVDDMFYSLLSTNNLNVTIENDVDILKSKSLSLAIEICGILSSNVLLRPSKEDLAQVNSISILKKIKKYGWNLNVSSVQFSKTNRIRRPKKEGFWDGHKYFNVEASSDGTFAVESSLDKHFRNSTFADIRMNFDGTIIGQMKDLNQIIDSPLEQQWNVDLYGRVALTILFKMEGKVVKLALDGLAGSVGYASFGGSRGKEVHGMEGGFFFTTVMAKDPFVNTSLKNFADMSAERNISCFLSTSIYKEKYHIYHTEITDSLSCVFRGILKVGGLRFHPLQVNLRMGKSLGVNIEGHNTTKLSQNIVELIGVYTESKISTFGIFKRSPESCGKIRFSFAQNTPKYFGSFCALCNIFGMEKLVNVSISYEGLNFQVSGKMYDLYQTSMNCSTNLLSWENQVYEVEGQFEKSGGRNDFVAILKKELDNFAQNFILQAEKRVQAVDRAVKRAHDRLEKVLLLRNEASNKLEQMTSEYAFVTENSETAEQHLEFLEIEARNFSKDLKKSKSDLDSLCDIKVCPEVCQEGISCTTCYEYIIANSMGMCPATCSRTEQRLVPPYSEVAYCDRQSCKRIHSTNGFFKRVFGTFFGGVVKSALSFGISVIAGIFVPPPAAAAIGSGITTFLDTGRPEEAICAAVRAATGTALAEKVGGKFSKYIPEIIDKQTGSKVLKLGTKLVFGNLIKCQREQRDGQWKCRVETVQCQKGRFEYEYKHVPYICKKSCVIQTITKTVERSCCSNVSCALFIVNVSCVAENVLCKKARVDALEKIIKTKFQAENVLKVLEDAKSNSSYWNLRRQKKYRSLIRQRRWFNTTQTTVHSLEKAYNNTIESKKEIVNILSTPLGLVKSLLNEEENSLEGLKVKKISFKAKLFAGSNDIALLPIDITIKANKTLHHLSTVFDFAHPNSSLKSIAGEIMGKIIGNTDRSSRKKRSVETPSINSDILLLSLKQFHTYCAKFTNYYQTLYNVAISLYNLSSEMVFLKQSLFESDLSALNITNLIWVPKIALNETTASRLGLEKRNYSRPEYLKYDPEMSEAIELQKEEMLKNYEHLNSTSRLLVYNWLATMEEVFNSSRLSYECSGMNDCIAHILDSMVQMFSVIEADGVDHIRRKIDNLEDALGDLTNDMTLDEAVKLSSGILKILKEMVELEVVCAQPPNITKNPSPITELGIGNVLMLQCNATGTALLYSWTFNGHFLPHERSNVLTIDNTTLANSGNYTCVASNHIAKERSIRAVVIIHRPPVIINQPVRYLAIVLSEDDFLHCQVEETGKNISYQWWFKYSNASSSFAPLYNETFSYLDFSPMRTKYEGWYFCKASNLYGVTSSRISFVKAVSFTLPVPMAVLTFSLNRKTVHVNSTVEHSSTIGYSVISSHILSQILSDEKNSDGVHVDNLRPINCQLGKMKNNTNGYVGICSWKFQYIGKNVTSNKTVYNDFKVNAGMVINATQELSETIQNLVNRTNNGSLSFSVAGSQYFAEGNSIAVEKFSLFCPKNQELVQQDFKCVVCPAGYHAVLGKDKLTTCVPCPLGFYQFEAGKTTCTQCPKGYTTHQIGSYEHAHCKAICNPGQYGTVREGIGYCYPCPLNEYQPQEGQSECLPCDKDHVTRTEGAWESNQCILIPEATESPNITTERTTEGTAERTTETVHEERGSKDGEQSNKSLIIGLTLGVSFLIVVLIVVSILIIRRRLSLKENLNIKNQMTGESRIRHHNLDNDAVGYAFQNAIYDDASEKIKSENMDDDQSSSVDLKNAKNGVANVKPTETTSAFENPAFEEMSAC